MQEISQPFKLSGAKNVRELGGHHVFGGGMTQMRRFLRGNELQNLTDADCRILYEYGVRQIIDLRSQSEVLRGPDRLPQCYSDVAWLNVPMSDHVRGNRYSGEFPPSMWQLYKWLLDDGGDSFRLIFQTILQMTDGCVLIHCVDGKDRTGIVSMLRLKLAGVSDDIVACDYALTEQAMKDIFPRQRAVMKSRGLVVPAYVLQSPPENMFITLTYLRDTYGSGAGYLAYIGLSDNEIATLRERLLGAFREQA